MSDEFLRRERRLARAALAFSLFSLSLALLNLWASVGFTTHFRIEACGPYRCLVF